MSRVDDGRRYGGDHAIVPERTHHDADQIGVIAPDRLRDELDLVDDDRVALRVVDAERADR